jgi:hypothetical protein
VLTYRHYEDPDDGPTEEEAGIAEGLETRRDWRFLNTVNRVCSGVKKVRAAPALHRAWTHAPAPAQTLLLVYVTVPSRRRCPPQLIAQGPQACLQLYSVREIAVRRFVPTRLRD